MAQGGAFQQWPCRRNHRSIDFNIFNQCPGTYKSSVFSLHVVLEEVNKATICKGWKFKKKIFNFLQYSNCPIKYINWGFTAWLWNYHRSVSRYIKFGIDPQRFRIPTKTNNPSNKIACLWYRPLYIRIDTPKQMLLMICGLLSVVRCWSVSSTSMLLNWQWTDLQGYRKICYVNPQKLIT